MSRQAQRQEPKPKFVAQREESIKVDPIRPMNKKQRAYIEAITNNNIVIATGYAGTSKSYLAVSMAADALRLGRIDSIIFARPAISNSKSLGYFAGTLEEKMAVWLEPVMNILKQRLTTGGVEIYIKRGSIKFQPLETIKGLSVENAWLVCDEAEDITVDEAKKVVTRLGKNAKIILAGDISQSELKEKSGLRYLKDVAERHSLPVGIVDFNDPNDIVRSDDVKRWIIAFNREERSGGTH